MNKKIAVIAGTPVDAQMGVDFLKTKDVEGYLYPVSPDPKEQTIFQTMDYNKRKEALLELIQKIKKDGMDSIMVYCNSMSSSIDFSELAEIENIKIVTPLDAYRTFAKNYTYIGVLAANNQATSGIEKSIVNENADCTVIGTGMLTLVFDIEDGMKPEDILTKNHIDKLVKFYESIEVEGLILGCTHFPYFKEAIKNITKLNIIDPAEKMFELLMSN